MQTLLYAEGHLWTAMDFGSDFVYLNCGEEQDDLEKVKIREEDDAVLSESDESTDDGEVNNNNNNYTDVFFPPSWYMTGTGGHHFYACPWKCMLIVKQCTQGKIYLEQRKICAKTYEYTNPYQRVI